MGPAPLLRVARLMARSYAAIHLRIWADPEWRALDGDAQLLYLLLLSQPSLNLAGVLPLQTRRWAACVADWDAPAVDMALSRLAEARFVVIDLDTEEVLVRSFIRNDGNYKIPNALKSLLLVAEGTQSPLLRAELADELGRLDPLTGKKADEGQALIAAARVALGGPSGPSGPGGEPMPDGFVVTHAATVAGTVDQPIAEPMPQPIGSGSGSGKYLSLVGNSGEEGPPAPISDEPDNCPKHRGQGRDAPPCRACKPLREQWEAALAEAARPKPLPPLCGDCDNRWVQPDDDGPAKHCPTCHPLAQESA